MFGINQLSQVASKKAALLALAVASVGGLGASSARAGHDDKRVDIDFQIRIGEPHPRQPRYEERKTRVWVEPVYRTVCDRRWIEPVFEDRCEKVWIEPVYETRCEKVWVPDRFECRTERFYDRHCGRWMTRTEHVLVERGHFETRETRVCVREGRFEEVHNRVCVSEGRWETFDRQELVCEGHWEWKTERVCVDDGRGYDRRDWNHDHDGHRDDRRRVEVVNPNVRF